MEKESIKDEILSQAQMLFKQFGLKKTTMDEIALASGKAKATLYHYFKNKEEVVKAVLDIEMRGLRIKVKRIVDSKQAFEDKLETYLTKYYEGIMERSNLYRLISSDIVNGTSSKKYFNRLFKFEKSYFKRLLEDGFDMGDIVSIKKEELDWFAETLLIAFFGIIRHDIENENKMNAQRIEKVTNLLLHRVLA